MRVSLQCNGRDTRKLLIVNCFGSPALEEAQGLALVISLAFLQETGVLDMDYLAIGVEEHKHWESEALRVVKPVHQLGYFSCGCLAR